MIQAEENRLLLVANDKLDTAAAKLQSFVSTGSPESYRQLAARSLVRDGDGH